MRSNALGTSFYLVLLLLQLPRLATAWTLRFHLPAHAGIPLYNPSLLPPNTHATLFKQGTTLNTLLTRRNTLEFTNLEAGSYLFTLTCRDWAFSPFRVDVNTTSTTPKGKPEARADVWQTFWGNEWGNKGEYRGGGAVGMGDGKDVQPAVDENVVQVDLFPMGKKEYYLERSGFNALSFLKSPMILMGLFSLVMIVGLPYLMENSGLPLQVCESWS